MSKLYLFAGVVLVGLLITLDESNGHTYEFKTLPGKTYKNLSLFESLGLE